MFPTQTYPKSLLLDFEGRFLFPTGFNENSTCPRNEMHGFLMQHLARKAKAHVRKQCVPARPFFVCWEQAAHLLRARHCSRQVVVEVLHQPGSLAGAACSVPGPEAKQWSRTGPRFHGEPGLLFAGEPL